MSDTNAMVDELSDEEMKMLSGEAPTDTTVEDKPAGEDKPADTPKDEPKEETKKEEPNKGDDDKKKDETKSEGEADEDDEGFEAELDGNKGRFVRHGAFHKAREKAKEYRSRLAERDKELAEHREKTAAEMARVNERLAILAQLQRTGVAQQQEQKTAGEQKQVPNPETHPFEYMRYLGEQMEKLGQTQTNVQERFQEQDSYTQLQTVFKADADRFVQQKPDFGHAYGFLLSARDRELHRLGYTDAARRAEVIAQEEARIVAYAVQNGKSPSELVYALAHDRGYRKPEPQPSAEELTAAEAAKQQEQQPAQQQQQQTPSAVDQIRQLKTATSAQKSLSQAAGGSGQVLTAEALAGMDDAEFDKIVSNLTPAQRREIFGDA